MDNDASSLAGNAAIERSLALLEALAGQQGERPLSDIARELGLPPSTAHRLTALLVRRGLIAPGKRGHYGPGLALVELSAQADPHAIIARAARAPLRQLATAMETTAHLGVWDGDMVTYLVKEAVRGATLFTQEGGQLEAYCSAIGKVLLANLGRDVQDAYLSAGPFVPLTAYTVTEPDGIRAMLDNAARDGFAFDNREIAEDLNCVAIPVRRSNGQVVAAISLSRSGNGAAFTQPPEEMRACAEAIGKRLG